MRFNLNRLGIVGTIIAALCCFTPILTGLLAVIGLTWLIGYLDLALFPALFFFIGITIYALWRKDHFQSKTNQSTRVEEITRDNGI